MLVMGSLESLHSYLKELTDRNYQVNFWYEQCTNAIHINLCMTNPCTGETYTIHKSITYDIFRIGWESKIASEFIIERTLREMTVQLEEDMKNGYDN